MVLMLFYFSHFHTWIPFTAERVWVDRSEPSVVRVRSSVDPRALSSHEWAVRLVRPRGFAASCGGSFLCPWLCHMFVQAAHAAAKSPGVAPGQNWDTWRGLMVAVVCGELRRSRIDGGAPLINLLKWGPPLSRPATMTSL